MDVRLHERRADQLSAHVQLGPAVTGKLPRDAGYGSGGDSDVGESRPAFNPGIPDDQVGIHLASPSDRQIASARPRPGAGTGGDARHWFGAVPPSSVASCA